jgi:predicted AAA+ superfamily ATPase
LIVEKLQDTQAVFFVNRISKKIYKKESWPRKAYICDTGISTIFRFSKDIGKLMENAVFLELKRMQNERPILGIYYYRDYQQREVDFVLKDGLEVKALILADNAKFKMQSAKCKVQKSKFNRWR